MRNRHRFQTLAALAFMACSLVGVGRARAESRAWAAAKGVLPADTAYVIGFNVTPFKSSKLFKQFWDMAMAQSKDAKDNFALFKKTCKMDVTTSLDSAVVAMNDKMQGGIYVALNKVDEPKFTACVVKMVKKQKKKKITATKDGNIVVYKGDDKDVHIGWIGKDTIVFTTTPEDKALLQKYLTAATLGADLTKAVGAIKTDAAVWGAAVKATPLPNAKGTLKMGYGSIDLSGGNITLDGHIIMASAAEAKAVVDEANKGVAAMPAEFDSLKKGLKISATAADVAIAFSITEKEVLELVKKYMPQNAPQKGKGAAKGTKGAK